MPGYADYKRLFVEEYKTLYDEGYDVEKYIVNDENSADFCPNPQNAEGYPTGDGFWQRPYENLIKVMGTPTRADYPYIEPNDYEGIMASTPEAPTLEPLDDEEYEKRIKGAFYGRCASVILGKPLEMGLSKDFIKKYLESLDITAKIRYAAKPAQAKLCFLEDGRVKTIFNDAQRAPTPGQSIVFYIDDLVLGGGFIE